MNCAMEEQLEVKCYICGCFLTDSNNFELLFGESVPEGGGAPRPLADILAKILGCNIIENQQNSMCVCTPCVVTLETYESLEQQLGNLRTLVVNTYNLTEREIDLLNLKEIDVLGITTEGTSYISDINEELIDVDSVLQSVEASGEKVGEEMSLHSDDQPNDLYDEYESLDVIVDDEGELVKADQVIFDGESMLIKEETNGVEDTRFIEYYENVELPDAVSSKERETTKSLTDGKYICTLCTPQTTYPNLSSLKKHRDEVHIVEICTCEICGEVYECLDDLHSHMDTVHEGIIRTKCEECDATFNKFSNLCVHMKAQMRSQIYQTDYRKVSHLKNQMRKHQTAGGLKCDECGMVFSTNSKLKVHLETHKIRQRNFACNQCNKAFVKEGALRQHLSIHSGVKSFICEICNKSFQTKYTLQTHMAIHSDLKPHICPTCGKTFVRRNDLSDHERVHTGERPYKCDLCNAAFAQRSNLASHKKSTHFDQKSYKCEQCGKGFKRRRLLDYHMKSTHTGERPIVCTVCSATFVHPDYFKRHLLIHTGVKPYACEICGKTFHSRDNRNAHRFVHCNKKPYECIECGEGFMRKPQLLAHLKISQHSSEMIIKNEPQITSDLKRTFDPDEEPCTSTDLIVVSQRINIKN